MAQCKILYSASTANHLRSFHLPYLSALVECGAEVTCVASGTPEGFPEGVRFLRVPFTKKMTAPQNLQAARQIAQELRYGRYDLVLCHTSLAAFFTRLGVRLAGKGASRVVNVVHGYLFDDSTPLPRRQWMLTAEKIMASVTDEIITMNRQDTDIAEKNKLCRGKVLQIPGMGYDAVRCSVPPEQDRFLARQSLGIPADAVVLLYAAEFSPRKNQDFLLRALQRMDRRYVLVLPGDGELQENCVRHAKELGLSRRVFFPGQVQNMADCRAAADICVSSSRSEGLPFHVMESMASGLPCVLSDVKGHQDLSFGAVLYPFGNETAFINAVEQIPLERHIPEQIASYSVQRVLTTNLNLFTGGLYNE